MEGNSTSNEKDYIDLPKENTKKILYQIKELENKILVSKQIYRDW